MKNGQPIKFSIEDPSSYTDYATDAQLIANQLNAEGFEVSFDGVQATQWYTDSPPGTSTRSSTGATRDPPVGLLRLLDGRHPVRTDRQARRRRLRPV